MAPSPEKAPSPDSSGSPPSDSGSSSPPPSTNSSSPPPKSSPSPPPTSSPPSKSPPPPENSPPPPPDSSPPPPPSDPSNNPPSSSSSSPPPPPSRKSDSPVPPSPPNSSPPRTTTPPDALSPPPPPRSSGKFSPSNGSPSKGDNDSNSPSPNKHSNDINVPLIAGVTAAVGVLFLLMLISACLCCKKKKRKHHNSMHYYADSGPKGDYYNGGPPPNWQNGNQGMDHGSKLPPPPGGGGAWHQPPTMMTNNSDYMSSNYSGPHGPALPPPSPTLALGFNKSTFSYEELAAATGGFAQSNLLGQGGFGYVFKGVLPNGKDIAVKQLKSGSGQGEREFQAEVDIISRVHHRHLVSLVGYCIAGAHRMLVYEFVPNKTLEYHLHGKGLPVMDWPTRLRIALGSAKGLAYLHEDCHPRIIHRDIKAANILLDYKFEAMVADFGLAKLSQDNYTHVSTRIMGTFGYLAPEYASSGKLTDKSDVFSFGIMLLELITGRRPVDAAQMEDSLVDWARPLLSRALTEGIYEELVDPRLEGNYNTTEMARMVASAAASVRHSAKRRSKMSQIVRALEGDVSLDDLNEGVKPGQSGMFSSDYDSSSYGSDMKRFRQVALASNEFSEDYGPTSEYGLNASTSSSSGESHVGSRNKPPVPHL